MSVQATIDKYKRRATGAADMLENLRQSAKPVAFQRVPVLYVGAPGIGKTAKILAQYDFAEVLLLSGKNEESLTGLPYRDGEMERYTVPQAIERLQAHAAQHPDQTRVLFLDELDKARREVADTILSLIQNPELFGIPAGTAILAAANPPEWGGGDGISKAMQSRFAVVQAAPDVKGWAEWALNAYPGIPAIARCVDRIRNREIPILEENGEDYEWRLTCPRTIERAWQALLDGMPDLVPGLLTPNAASGVMLCFAEEADSMQDVARHVGAAVRNGAAAHVTTKAPLRLP